MRFLDHSRPFSEVWGGPGVRYEQDGYIFKPNGEEDIPAPVEAVAAPPPPAPKPAPAKHRKPALKATTVLAAQFGGEEFVERFGFPEEPARDVLASYRDPQNADGSMVIAPRAWVDGV